MRDGKPDRSIDTNGKGKVSLSGSASLYHSILCTFHSRASLEELQKLLELSFLVVNMECIIQADYRWESSLFHTRSMMRAIFHQGLRIGTGERG